MKHLSKILIVVCFLCVGKLAHTQKLFVFDAITRQPIKDVSVCNESKTICILTDVKGQADISEFNKNEKISLSHSSYKLLEISYEAVAVNAYKIYLEEKIISLNEVVFSGSKWEKNKVETPNRIEKINMKEAAFQNPQTTADLLGMSGYAFIQKSQLGGGSPMLRGFATNRVLLVIDDVRMNTAIFRSGNLQNVISLDANAIESSEIMFGPGAVMYGSDAIGGVMSFYTLRPMLASNNANGPVFSGNLMTRISSANMENTGHVDFNIGLKKFAFTTSFTNAVYNDLRSGSVGGSPYFYRTNYVITYDNKDYMIPNYDSTLQVGSKYSQVNFMQKVLYQHNQYLSFKYGYHFSETSKYNRYDRLYVMQTSGPYKNKLRWAEWYYGPQKWQMHHLNISYNKKNIAFDKLKFTAAYQFFEESRYDREFMFRELHAQIENVHAISNNLDLEKKLGAKITLNYGLETVYNLVRSRASLTHVVTKQVLPTVTRYPDGSTWQSYGAYLSAKYNIHPKIFIDAGLRYSRFMIDATFDTTFFPFPFLTANMRTQSLNGSIGAVYCPQSSWQLYANAATGFRAPNVDDMGKVFESVPGYLVVPNPNLKPESVINIEAGTNKSFGEFLRIDASIYKTWLDDAMARRNFTFNGDTTIRYLGNKSRIQAIQNVAKIDVYGIQAGIEFSYKGFGIRSNYSFQNGREQNPDSLNYYPLRHAAPNFGSTHITYTHKKVKADFYAVYNAKMTFEDLALTERTNASYARDEFGRPYVDAWYTLNFKIAFYPSQYLSINLGIENIMDILYRPYASGINAPGRNIIASVRAKF
jgi:hemoglobin/transferrin/lactoferrin receptor protein